MRKRRLQPQRRHNQSTAPKHKEQPLNLRHLSAVWRFPDTRYIPLDYESDHVHCCFSGLDPKHAFFLVDTFRSAKRNPDLYSLACGYLENSAHGVLGRMDRAEGGQLACVKCLCRKSRRIHYTKKISPKVLHSVAKECEDMHGNEHDMRRGR